MNRPPELDTLAAVVENATPTALIMLPAAYVLHWHQYTVALESKKDAVHNLTKGLPVDTDAPLPSCDLNRPTQKALLPTLHPPKNVSRC